MKCHQGFRAGRRVRLKPFHNGEEMVPEQYGHLLHNGVDNGTVTVELDVKYRDEDDVNGGVMEIPVDQVQLL